MPPLVVPARVACREALQLPEQLRCQTDRGYADADRFTYSDWRP